MAGIKLDKTFSAVIQKSPKKGGWTYIIWAESVAFFKTKGLVKVKGTMDNYPFSSSFMALGTGQHKLPVKGIILQAIHKTTGDSITIHLEERL